MAKTKSWHEKLRCLPEGLPKEGNVVEMGRGKKLRVKDYEQALWAPS